MRAKRSPERLQDRQHPLLDRIVCCLRQSRRVTSLCATVAHTVTDDRAEVLERINKIYVLAGEREVEASPLLARDVETHYREGATGG